MNGQVLIAKNNVMAKKYKKCQKYQFSPKIPFFSENTPINLRV